MGDTQPGMIVNPALGVDELLDELAARLQQLYGSLDALAVSADSEGAELFYDALWALLEDVHQIQSLRDALADRVSPGKHPSAQHDTPGIKH